MYEKRQNYPTEALLLLKKLAVIPAPSGMEEKRAVFCRDYLRERGAENACIDEAGNVILPIGDVKHGPVTAFLAHSDVVFPDLTDLPWSEDEEWISCPGIADNTVHIVDLLLVFARLIEEKRPPKEGGVLLVINVGEEGLGNLKGSRYLMKTYGDRIREMIILDSVNAEIVTKAVGSVRYKITANCRGGHGYRDFGAPNAIERLAEVIEKLWHCPMPSNGKSSRNVGIIEGGTSINTIPQAASMLYEYRSDSREDLEILTQQLLEVIRETDREDAPLTCELIGERPCSGNVDEKAMDKLIKTAEFLIRKHYKEEPYLSSGSTDANAALSEGIPAICFGACRGEGAHTREERLRKDSLLPGLKLTEELVRSYFR